MQKSDRQLQLQQFEFGGYRPFPPSFPPFYSLAANPSFPFPFPPFRLPFPFHIVTSLPLPFLPFPTLISTLPFTEVQLLGVWRNAEISPVGPGGTPSPNALDLSVALKSDLAVQFRTYGTYDER